MYGSEKYRNFPSFYDSALPPVFDYIIVLYSNLFVFTGFDGFTSRWRRLFEVAKFNMINSAINDSRVFVTIFDEWAAEAPA